VDHGRLGIWFASAVGELPTELEEEEGDAPTEYGTSHAPNAFSVSSILGFSGFRGYNSVQVNVDRFGKNIPGDAANEPSMTIDPTNRKRIAVGWRQFDNVTSDFRQGGFSSSFDGGKSWRTRGNLEPGVFRSDPVLASTSEGKFYYLSLKQTFFDDVFPSENGGASWGGFSAATGGDKQWMTVDRTNGIGKGNLYQAWSTAGNNYGGRQFSRSTDNGQTWIDPVSIPSQPVWGTLDVGKNGDVYVCGLANPFSFVRSKNAQDRTKTPTFDFVQPVNLGGSIVYGSFINPVGLTGQVWMAVDRGPSAQSGNIYMLCSVGVDATNPCDVNFVRSTDGGKTWTPPRRINDDARGKGNWHWFGAMSVAPNGRIDVCWYDTRANPGTGLSALYYSSSSDGGQTWSPNRQVSQVFDPSLGYPVQRKMGDYMAVVSDDSGANVAYAATFNGEEDVWYLRIPVGPTISVKADAVRKYTGASATGDRTKIWTIDNLTYDVRSTLLTGLGQAAAIQTDYTMPNPSAIGSLAVHLRAKSSQATTGMVWLFNWKTGAYDLLSAAPMGAGENVELTLRVPDPIAPYLDSGGHVRAIFRSLLPIKNGQSPVFDLRTDLMEMLYG